MFEKVMSGERRTFLVTVITATMMFVEIATGVAFGSMALLADGLHMASHTAALGIAVFTPKIRKIFRQYFNGSIFTVLI